MITPTIQQLTSLLQRAWSAVGTDDCDWTEVERVRAEASSLGIRLPLDNEPLGEPTAIDTFIESIETDGYIAVFQSGSPMFNELMLRVVPIFEAYPKSDQALALACMFGILIGEMEGETVDGEKLGVIITLEDRIRIFLAQARVVAKATIADKVMGDRPVQGGVQ